MLELAEKLHFPNEQFVETEIADEPLMHRLDDNIGVVLVVLRKEHPPHTSFTQEVDEFITTVQYGLTDCHQDFNSASMLW